MGKNITFELSPEQAKKFKDWQEAKPKEVYVGAIGGAYEFCFTPTGVGLIIVIKCADGTELDLTEYELF